ncbi:MAG: VOC family protein [Amphritea sp.]
MSLESCKPAEMDWLTPYLTVSDADKSLAFYQQAFGFVTGNLMPDKAGKPMHCEMNYRGRILFMFSPEGSWGNIAVTPEHSGQKSPIGLYVYCNDVDAQVTTAVSQGAVMINEPETMFWGDRVACVSDPDGYMWTFATKVAEFDPTQIPDM